MDLDYVPLLRVQRDLYDLPRGYDRFRAYLATMIDPQTRDLKLPLVAMNPMGKDHLPPFLDALIAMDADAAAARAVGEARAALTSEPGAFKVALVVSDDLKGGWTNRYTSELGHLFEQKAFYRRGWVAAILWTSETYTPALVREETLLAVHRAAYAQRHGYAQTLGEMLDQETHAMAHADASGPLLEDDDLEYSRQVLAPLRQRTDRATIVAALFGDEAARQLGYPPLGLSARAGLAVAFDAARVSK
jgi:hypothetical protein